MSERDILSPEDRRATLIADEKDAARAEVVAPPGWIVVTTWDAAKIVVNAKRIVSFQACYDMGAETILVTSNDGCLNVTETPAEIAALIARAQQPQRPAGDAELLREMAEALGAAKVAMERALDTPMVSRGIGVLHEGVRAIRAALTRYGQRGAR